MSIESTGLGEHETPRAGNRCGARGSAVYTIEEVARLLGISRNKAYEAAGTDFPIIRIGKRMLAPRAAIDAMLGISGRPVPSIT
jgi:Helix-turn-helix domain